MSGAGVVVPVVGMEFVDDSGGRSTIVRVTMRDVLCREPDDDGWRMTRAQFARCQMLGTFRPVLWTVGPGEGDWTRTMSDERAIVLKFEDGGYYADRASRDKHLTVLWPTRAAALAAGRAFGWKRPVARRVVRKETGR